MNRSIKTAMVVTMMADVLIRPATGKELSEPKLSQILLIDDSGEPENTERTVALGNVIMDLAIAVKASAMITKDGSIDGMAWVPINFLLRKAQLEPDDVRKSRDSLVYCTIKFAVPAHVRSAKRTNERRSRFDKEVRACFIDESSDAAFDKIFFVGARWNSDQLPTPIDPLAYTSQSMTPLPGRRWRLVAKKEDRTRTLGALGLLSQRYVFQAQSNFATSYFNEVDTRLLDEGCNRDNIAINTGLKTKRVPRKYKFGCSEILVTAFDKKAKRLTYSIQNQMPPTAVSLTVSFLDINGGTVYKLE